MIMPEVILVDGFSGVALGKFATIEDAIDSPQYYRTENPDFILVGFKDDPLLEDSDIFSLEDKRINLPRLRKS